MTWVYRILVSCLRHIPKVVIENFFWYLSLLALCVAKKERNKIYKNLELTQSLRGGSFPKVFARQVLFFQAQCYFDSVMECLYPGYLVIENRRAFSSFICEIENRERSEYKGCVLSAAHLGSWELVGKCTKDVSEFPFYALAKPARSKRGTEFLGYLREKSDMRVLWTDRKTLFKEILQAAKSRTWIGFVMDQKPKRNSGTLVNFMGRKTEFVLGPAIVALKTSSPVVSVFCLRIGRGHYKLEFDEVFDGDAKKLQANERDSQVVELTQMMATRIESAIMSYPEQWVWNYKRWRNA